MCVCLCTQLWTSLQPDVALTGRISTQWTLIGFQGSDPATDFRGMGLLGLLNLVYVHYVITIIISFRCVQSNLSKWILLKWITRFNGYHHPRESEGLWNHRRTFVCLFVTMITNKTWTNLDEIFWEGS